MPVTPPVRHIVVYYQLLVSCYPSYPDNRRAQMTRLHVGVVLTEVGMLVTR
jgi:hypothetical protein